MAATREMVPRVVVMTQGIKEAAALEAALSLPPGALQSHQMVATVEGTAATARRARVARAPIAAASASGATRSQTK